MYICLKTYIFLQILKGKLKKIFLTKSPTIYFCRYRRDNYRKFSSVCIFNCFFPPCSTILETNKFGLNIVQCIFIFLYKVYCNVSLVSCIENSQTILFVSSVFEVIFNAAICWLMPIIILIIYYYFNNLLLF